LDEPKRPEERRPLAAWGSRVNVVPPRISPATCRQYLRLTAIKGNRIMRAVIFLLIVAVLIIIAGVASGYLKISQRRPAEAPQLTATGNGVTAKGGQAPAFDVETGSVKVGTKETTVKVPSIEVQKPDQNRAATNNDQ